MKTGEPLGDWAPEELEENGRALLARLRTHFAGIRDVPVTPGISAVELQRRIDAELPEDPTPFPRLLDETWDDVVSHLALWHHPNFHAYFSNSSSGPAILAEMLTAALNVNAQQWRTAPAASAVERTVLGWLAAMAGYPVDADGVLVNGASLAVTYALVAARDAVPGLQVRERGIAGRELPVMRVYTSDQAHSSVDKAAIALGIGLDNVVRLPTDGHHRLAPAALAAALDKDIAAGVLPLAVCATAGTTSTGAIDPVDELAKMCAERGVWLHVDAAFGGFWRLVDRLVPELADLGAADSVVVNPHKVLFCPMEVSAFYCRRRGALPDAFRLVPEYLRTVPDEGSVDFMDYSLQLGRQFRALKVWWVIRSFGRAGLARRLADRVDYADWLRAAATNHPDWTVVADSVLPLVCLRYDPGGTPPAGVDRRAWLDELNEAICLAVHQSGRSFVSHTVLDVGYVIRVSIGNIQTTATDIHALWELLNDTATACHDRTCAVREETA
ncbi:pyridoxal phosphate-dependent decarboxylase family protein [Actinophytocola sp. NPDC049390]|uniref:pyridoxal phosphate-dependent decarboxylase family protein n=1 Tax=Actinophytocola sp. NPDC049390 TaxID=3363894 RepID=UPI0037AB8535